MAETPRYLAGQILADLDRKMVFVAGPRQVGKTTLARGLPGAAGHRAYRRGSGAAALGCCLGGSAL